MLDIQISEEALWYQHIHSTPLYIMKYTKNHRLLSQLFCLCRNCHKFYFTLEKDYFGNPSKLRRFSFITNDFVMLYEDIQKALSLQLLWYDINIYIFFNRVYETRHYFIFENCACRVKISNLSKSDMQFIHR